MKIRDLFRQSISRPINGVVKADQLGEEIVWQELSEYVITGELDRHFRKFLSAYLAVLDDPRNHVIASRMGVWISGFFGSGKSHFLKILSYLLANREAHDESGESKKAVDFFEGKVTDPMLMGDIRRAAATDTDVVLFNIDSKADKTDGDAALLGVFWKVFNELQGFCPTYPYIAELERFLARKGKLESFCSAFNELTGSTWQQEWDAFHLMQDEISQALVQTLGKDQESVTEWLKNLESGFSLTVEGFATRVKEYLDSRQSPKHRIVFLVDEVGQFIGDNSQLMLNLQTIAEDLGRMCDGRAWIVVTSQEDIDGVLGEINNPRKMDFSKITGRFHTRLSLSSSNTDEVIQWRLLHKNASCLGELRSLYKEKGDIINNQLSFSSDSTTLKKFNNEDDFINYYPFAPFHFQLVQKMFEEIRRKGFTGLHLSRGERSMLDAFQSAAVNIADKEVGALVPLYEFFPCIEGFLDTSAKLSIENAAKNPGLQQPFDGQLLRTLFLIRYVDLIKPNVENLVTLCIDEVDADRIALKRVIEESLQRLEKQNLVSRNGDLYYFLTDEEREVSREIKAVELNAAEEINILAEILFDDLLKGKKLHKYAQNRDYGFNRICDAHPYGSRGEQDLTVEFLTPLSDQYTTEDARCIMYSGNNQGSVLIRLPDTAQLKDALRELKLYLKTERYIKQKSDPGASPTRRRILNDHQGENQQRKGRIAAMMEQVLPAADFFALGGKQNISAANTRAAVDEALDYLIENLYNKYSLLIPFSGNVEQEIKATLLTDDAGQQRLIEDLKTANVQATREVRLRIDLLLGQNHPVVLSELVEHFTKRPFGWRDWDIILMIARLFVGGELMLLQEGGKLQPSQSLEYLLKRAQWKNIKIRNVKKPREEDIKAAREIVGKLFGSVAPEALDELVRHAKKHLHKWKSTLESFQHIASTGKYPGGKEIESGVQLTGELLAIHESFEFILSVVSRKNDLDVLAEDFHDLNGFYETQKGAWQEMLDALEAFKPNRVIIEQQNDEAARALERLDQIVTSQAPYALVREIPSLVEAVREVDDVLTGGARTAALEEIDKKIETVKQELDRRKAKGELRNTCLHPLQKLKQRIGTENSIPTIQYQLGAADGLVEDAFAAIEREFEPIKPLPPTVTVKVSQLATKPYLETEEDVDSFITSMRGKLLDPIREKKRVKVQ